MYSPIQTPTIVTNTCDNIINKFGLIKLEQIRAMGLKSQSTSLWTLTLHEAQITVQS
jgi:hypothetical protein